MNYNVEFCCCEGSPCALKKESGSSLHNGYGRNRCFSKSNGTHEACHGALPQDVRSEYSVKMSWSQNVLVENPLPLQVLKLDATQDEKLSHCLPMAPDESHLPVAPTKAPADQALNRPGARSIASQCRGNKYVHLRLALAALAP